MAQDRPDLCAVANVLSRSMARPSSTPVCALRQSRQAMGERCESLDRQRVKWRQDCPEEHFGTRPDGKPCDLFCHSLSSKVQVATQVARVSEGIGAQNVLKEIKFEANLSNWCDSSAAHGVLQCAGARKLKHLEELVSRKALSVMSMP